MAAFKPRAKQLTAKTSPGKTKPAFMAGGLTPGKTTGPIAFVPKPGGFTAPQPTAPVAPKPVAPVGQHAAPDSAYNNRVDSIEHNRAEQMSALDAQERVTKNDFGIDDPTNPFSRINGLKKSWLARDKGVSTSMAAKGQMYSGANERAAAGVRFGEAAATDDLRRQYADALASIGSSRSKVTFDSEEAKNQAFEDWIARAPDAEGLATPEQSAASTKIDNVEPGGRNLTERLKKNGQPHVNLGTGGHVLTAAKKKKPVVVKQSSQKTTKRKK